MDNDRSTIEMLIERAENYVKTSIELAKLKAIDKFAEIISSLASIIIVSIVVGMFLMLTNLGLAFWIGEMLGNIYYGFFTMAGFYLVIALIFILFKKSMLKIPVSNIIITQILKEKQR
jgi:phosphoglycerol transferase MdoB-like AlkP superfamily enzyme